MERTAATAAKSLAGRKNMAQLLYDDWCHMYEFGLSPDGPWAARRHWPHVVYPLASKVFRSELAKDAARLVGVVKASTISDVMLALEGVARMQDEKPVWLRAAVAVDEVAATAAPTAATAAPTAARALARTIYVDMGDVKGRVARIDDAGWSIISGPLGHDVRFSRTKMTLPLVEPTPSGQGSADGFWDCLNIPKTARPLVEAWCVAVFALPDAAVPILQLLGEQGTAKTSAMRYLVNLVDPQPAPTRRLPKDPDQLPITFAGNRVVGLDNLSSVSPDMSDALCQVVTGAGRVARALYTDSDTTLVYLRRVMALSAISLAGAGNDLLDRSLLVQLEPIDDGARKTDAEMDAAVAVAAPYALARIFDLCSIVLRTPDRGGPLPRMADFGKLLARLDDGLADGADRFGTFMGMVQGVQADALESDEWLKQIEIVVKYWKFSTGSAWTGTANDLMNAIKYSMPVNRWDDLERTPKNWPSTARGVAARLRRSAPALRRNGWDIDESVDPHTKRAVWSLKLV